MLRGVAVVFYPDAAPLREGAEDVVAEGTLEDIDYPPRREEEKPRSGRRRALRQDVPRSAVDRHPRALVVERDVGVREAVRRVRGVGREVGLDGLVGGGRGSGVEELEQRRAVAGPGRPGGVEAVANDVELNPAVRALREAAGRYLEPGARRDREARRASLVVAAGAEEAARGAGSKVDDQDGRRVVPQREAPPQRVPVRLRHRREGCDRRRRRSVAVVAQRENLLVEARVEGRGYGEGRRRRGEVATLYVVDGKRGVRRGRR